MPQTKLENFFWLMVSTDSSTHVSEDQKPISDSTGTRKRKRSDSEGSDVGISFPCLAFFSMSVDVFCIA